MSKTTFRWGLLAGCATATFAVAACSAAEPFTYTERVPYNWEIPLADAGADADGDAEGDADGGSEAGATGAVTAAQVAERTVFPPDHFWNKDISNEPVDPLGFKYIESMGLDKGLHADFGNPDPIAKKPGYGIPYQYVAADQKKVPVEFKWASESDPGPYPIPDNPLIEGGSDKHILMIDKDNWVLYELFEARLDGGKWKAGSGAIFDLKSNKARPAGWTSADAAGLAIFPGLVRADEVLDKKVINHALRFTAKVTQRAYVYPASHFASDRWDTSLPPMGIWCRLRSAYPIEGFPQSVQVILKALKKHGMILADNGSNYFISGAPDLRWSADDLKEIGRVKGRDFEVIKTGPTVHK